ncbi:UNVERIFIED_CONTAM: putative mitochondrial protein [Sesamum latifolium]|uniref:Mitochondrial protein n=1 Tax=Sesamum latifolium TaxID=2727402 RepID=A0AAW2WVR4_9LAMI
MTAKFSKLDKFEGVDFRRWQKKMHFLLTTLKAVYVLSTPLPDYMVDETVEQIRRRSKWKNDDYICRGHGMSDTLFNVYQNVESAKALWDALEAKYMAEDASSKKFLDDDVAWWIDWGATTHACKDRGWFKVFQPVDDGSILHMGNESSAPIVGVGSIVLEFTSGKTINLSNVFNTVLESRDAIFDETRFSSIPRPKDMIPSTSGTNKETESSKMTPDEPMELRKSKRDDPKIFDEAMKSQDVAFWKEAINDGMDSIMGNNTWVLADLPPGCKPLGCKWIFKKKMKVDGTIEKLRQD